MALYPGTQEMQTGGPLVSEKNKEGDDHEVCRCLYVGNGLYKAHTQDSAFANVSNYVLNKQP